MSRVRLTVAYDGTDFAGFQRQASEGARIRTVAGTLEARLAEVCGHPVNLVGAGRTDTGVHALGQVAHFDKMGGIPVARLERVLNTLLLPEIRVSGVEEVAEDFHARYSAVSRTYHYFLCARAPSPMLGRYVWWVPEISAGSTSGWTDRCRTGLASLEGTHDFGAFCTDRAEAVSTVRTVLSTAVEARGPLLRITLRGDGFLRSMVRLIVGELVESRAEDAFRERLEHPEMLPGKPAPAQGLFLTHVEYPDGYGEREPCDAWPPFL